MPQSKRSTIENHKDRAVIDFLLALDAPLPIISRRFGITKCAACRRRQYLARHEKHYLAALRRAARAAGLDRHSARKGII